MKMKKLFVATSLILATAAAVAYPISTTYYTDVVYYSDATYSTVVGEQITPCYGLREVTGVITSYKRTVERYSCGGPIP